MTGPVIARTPSEYVAKFYGGRVALVVFDATAGSCLCRDCLTSEQRALMVAWLHSLPEPPLTLLETARHRKVEP